MRIPVIRHSLVRKGKPLDLRIHNRKSRRLVGDHVVIVAHRELRRNRILSGFRLSVVRIRYTHFIR